MCGIVGVISKAPVNQLIYDALLLLQHRGQDAAGIVTMQGTKCYMHKARGMVRDVFRTRNMRSLLGTVGLGQARYPTAGNAYNEEEAQPFYVNAPFGIVLVHNGNLTNAHALKKELFDVDRRHINTESDTEVLINIVAHEVERAGRGVPLTPQLVFQAVSAVHSQRCADAPTLNPCMFEFVYLARPDSVMDGVSVYQARLNMGETLAQRVISTMPPSEIDVVIPIPESSRPSAMQLAQKIGKPYREG